MRPLALLAALAFVILAVALTARGVHHKAARSAMLRGPVDTIAGPVEPSDWFYRQRAFPVGEIDQDAFVVAQRQAAAMRASAKTGGAPAWEFAGPTNVGGRVTALAVQDFNTFYAGTGSGGVFKTTDGGVTFVPVGDDAFSLSIGDVALDPQNPQTVWVGTGEANGGGGSLTYGGSGVYRSDDGGGTWQSRGLEETGTIGRIVVDPADSDRIWVAASGKLFATDADRGVYRSTDGGANWSRTLTIDDSTGAVDLAVNPRDSDTLYVASWTRQRTQNRRSYGGLGSGIWRSADGGGTWTRLTVGIPTDSDVGRIGVAVAPSRPNVVYAVVNDATGNPRATLLSENGGDTWAQVQSAPGPSFGWWFGQVRVDPSDWRTVYAPSLNLYKSTTAGSAWSYASGSMHVDHHALWIDPTNLQRLIAGNDGGVYRSTNGGNSWAKAAGGFPATQFYTVEIDASEPHRLYGGAQDNNTVRTLTGRIDDWSAILGGDGHYVLVDPTNNQYVYAEWQYGSFYRSANGGASFQNARPGPGDRVNWSAPVAFDPETPSTLYFGTSRVYKTSDRAVSWTAVSSDLTLGPGDSNLVYGTLTTIGVSSVNGNRLWAGTDDGQVWTTGTGGAPWTNVSAGLPNRWVTRVTPHPSNPLTAVVTLSGYRWGEDAARAYRTDDGGATWQAIDAGLPEAPANDVLFDPVDPQRLFLATDVGAFWSQNGGVSWSALGADMPMVPVTDLDLEGRTLVAATYGRGMYKLDLTQLNTQTAGPPSEGVLELSIRPNPARSTTSVLVSGPQRSATTIVEVVDARGRVVNRRHVDGTATETSVHLDLTGLVPGVYLVRASSDGRVLATDAFTVMR